MTSESATLGRTTGETLADRLRQIRAATFVGRDDEIAMFRSALDRPAETAGFAVLYVWGPGGIGKSALLRRFADEAEAAGRDVTRVDGRMIERSPAGFERAAQAANLPGRVLLVDTFEACQGMEGWFWDTFLPGLPADALVVLASREPPDHRRRTDADWAAAVRLLPLANLSRAEAAALLLLRGVAEPLSDTLYAFTEGHPLALILAAEVASRHDGEPERWTPHEPAIRTLLDRLVGNLPSAAHRRALEICAHVFVTREDLLREVFGEQAAELFAWLRDRPFIEAGPEGLRPHDLVRDLLIADLRWRDPGGWRVMHKQVSSYFVERALNAVGSQVLPTQLALNYLHRHGDVMAKYITWRGRGEVYEDAYRPSDREAVLRMAERMDGRPGAALVAHWVDRQPDAFRVCRLAGTGQTVAFVAWLRLAEPDETDIQVDPLVAAIWQHAREAGMPRPGNKIAVQRFVNIDGEHPTSSTTMDLIYMRGVAICLREPGLAGTYIHMPNPDYWAPVLEYVGHDRLSGDLSSVFVHDWTAMPVRPWLDMLQNRLLHGPEPAEHRPQLAPLTRAEFDRAVRDLLRTWRHRPSIAVNPLINSRLAGDDELAARVEKLRTAVEDAVDALQGTSRGDTLHRTLAATFFHGTHTQEEAAERLKVPFGTYRHRLSAAVDQVVEELWRRATGADS
ncbi:ATP-binding protein [Micromonospora thermarum]|uniref:ATP-binding protein n=1 Tax=Micromonospora thermarum TaxID=2720024 RepID=A0ABX0Z6R5_9ACTN|nr:ATP-binding protein [Micromonospora thermarum]NJP31936.1 ATP-binding protein [Micromonospora thermarum]